MSDFYNVFEQKNNAFLYSYLEIQKTCVAPWRSYLSSLHEFLSSPFNPFYYSYLKNTSNAIFEMSDRLLRDYPKPKFNINRVMVGDHAYYIEEEIVIEKNFCNLIHFLKLPKINHLPKLLIVAPLSGHYASLLRDTVKGLLPFFDVYITDWINARDVPISKGFFDLDDYIDYCIEFISSLGPELSVMGVCQPSVPLSAAVAIMSNDPNLKDKVPVNTILMGGPIDARVSPTSVNKYTANKQIKWFDKNVITLVPIKYTGFGREVYPGFLQLLGFMSMNMKRHIGAHFELFQHLILGDEQSADKQKEFYDEYLAVMDMTAEFYLQTIKEVFIDYSLPQGRMISRGRNVKLSNIKDSALLVIEGEHDDITGHEQTKAAIELCSNIPAVKKHYHLQKGVGHYGLFHGSKYRKDVVPVIRDFCYRHIKI